jgi:hypothetical protein
MDRMPSTTEPNRAPETRAAPLRAGVGGPVCYPDASALYRPARIPAAERPALFAILAAAIVIAAMLFGTYYGNVVSTNRETQESVDAALARGATIDAPVLTSCVNMDGAAVKESLQNAGYTIIDVDEIKGAASTGSFDLVKIPQDMGVDDAVAAYLSGVESIDPATAARFLSGSFRLEQTNAPTTDLRLHYADFQAADADSTIDAAIEAQGFDASTASASAKDASGNTYRTGSANGMTWTVSTCPLNEVYNVKGLPETAMYVGIRLTA